MWNFAKAIMMSIGILSALPSWIGIVNPSVAADSTESRAELVGACKREAKRGHYRQLRTRIVLEHKKRMVVLCEALRTEISAVDARETALTNCLAEASRGPVNVNRRGGADRSHVARLKSICRSLAAQ